MPCNAVATIKTRLNLPTSLDQAIKEFTVDQGNIMLQIILKNLTGLPAQSGVNLAMNYGIINNGQIAIILKYDPQTKMITNARIEDKSGMSEARFANLTNMINEQTIKTAGLIKQAKALALIQKQYGGEITTAPNGSKIITFDL